MNCDSFVLILVVVDDGLVPERGFHVSTGTESLNPCCSGQWSRTSNSNFIETVSLES